MYTTPSSERIHIGFFGKRNAGKSSLANAVLDQALSIVSSEAGTTTDPVKKAMELIPVGPVVIIDTPGLDDEGELGELRIKKTKDMLDIINVAVIVVGGVDNFSQLEKDLISEFKNKSIPFILVINKKDEQKNGDEEKIAELASSYNKVIHISSFEKNDIELLKKAIVESIPVSQEKLIVGDLVKEGDTVILVIPIDTSAPKGRLILPQQLVLRELLDKKCIVTCCQPENLGASIDNLKNGPALVITDSQAFKEVAKIVPESIRLTSFSVLMARYKGNFNQLMSGANTLDKLDDGDKVLISEACTHHRQCDDIGSVKIPMLIQKYTGKNVDFSFTEGGSFPENLSDYKLVVHCGACMINEAEMSARMKRAANSQVPMINYGMLFAKVNGILDRITNILI